ncbi:hypothetical protein [Bifidobacterium callimiconis]|uniref:hypothetical protein n=1 Tax=Bifidobacterium callimiconis TaxID=2306973 RepID=UPI0013E08015|nr:hypothetical protein [Bifidobacterium callimiconis]
MCDDLWELYCDTERLMRQPATRFGFPNAATLHATVVGLASSALVNMDPLLACGDVLDWYEGIRKAVNPALGRASCLAHARTAGEWYGQSERTVR